MKTTKVTKDVQAEEALKFRSRMIESDGDINLIGLYDTLLSHRGKKFTYSERIADFNKIWNSHKVWQIWGR